MSDATTLLSLRRGAAFLFALCLVCASSVQAQCVKAENGVTVELLADGYNSTNTYSYIWGVTYGASNAWITSVLFQTAGGATSGAGVTPPDPWTASATSWTGHSGTIDGTIPAVQFDFVDGLQLQRNRTFRFSYTTVYQDPVRVVVVGSNGTLFDETFAQVECTLLPVELVRFDAAVDGTDAVLTWETASETNNAGFEVEHAAGADAAFVRSGYVDGAGTTTAARAYAFRLAGLAPGVHRFRLKQVDFDGTFSYSPEVEVTVAVPGAYVLSPAYPNPFNPQTQFTLTVAQGQHVRVEVFDALGRQVALLHDGPMAEGAAQTFTFEAGALPSGVYLYRAVGETFVATRRAMLLK